MKTFSEFMAEWADAFVPKVITPAGPERDTRVKSKKHPRPPKDTDKDDTDDTADDGDFKKKDKDKDEENS